MSDTKKINPAMNILIYKKEMLIEIFGTVDVSPDVLREYTSKLYADWHKNEIIIPHNGSNLNHVLREKRKVGGFKMMFAIVNGDIHVRVENPDDLVFLKLKYDF